MTPIKPPDLGQVSPLRQHSYSWMTAVYFVLFFLSIWLWVQPDLTYHDPFTYLDVTSPIYPNSSIDGYPLLPGTPVAIVEGYIIHLFRLGWLGAAMLTGIALASCLLLKRILRDDGKRWSWGVEYLPVIALLCSGALYARTVRDGVVALCAIAAWALFKIADRWRSGVRMILFFFCACLVYAASGYGISVFLALCLIDELRRHGDWRLVVAMSTVTATVVFIGASLVYLIDPAPVLSTVVPLLPDLHVYETTSGFTHGVRLMVLYGAPLALVLHSILPVPDPGKSRGPSRHRRKKHAHADGATRRFFNWRPLLFPAAVCLATLLAVWPCRRPGIRDRLTIAQSAALSDWNRLLAAVLRLAPADLKPSDIHLTARALYKQGRLLDDALRYPFARISAEYLLYSRELPRGGSEELAKWLCSSRTFFELGIWNAAENNTGDALTVLSYHPAGLRQMADFKLARSMPGAARPYLGALRCDFWYRREADSLLAAIDRADSTGFTAFFPELRASVPDIDSIGALITLQDVLEKNPDNRMAFEYMVFHYLISCDLGNLAGNIAGFRRMGCTTLPRLVEEAMAVYIHGMGKSCDLHGYEIWKATLARMAAGDLLYARAGENKKAALPALSALYGDSYFFYIMYGFSAATLL